MIEVRDLENISKLRVIVNDDIDNNSEEIKVTITLESGNEIKYTTINDISKYWRLLYLNDECIYEDIYNPEGKKIITNKLEDDDIYAIEEKIFEYIRKKFEE